MKTVCIFVNGIRTFPGRSKNWTGRAVTATNTRHPKNIHDFFYTDQIEVCAEKVEYFTFALTRGLLQKQRAAKLAKVLDYYADGSWNIILAGHSNGADVILDALTGKVVPPTIMRLHLISPAVDYDCAKNRLACLQQSGRLKSPPTIWVAGKDKALKWGGSIFGKLLGYGALGLKGPKKGTLPEWREICEPNFGHSEWFDEKNFDKTMERLWT